MAALALLGATFAVAVRWALAEHLQPQQALLRLRQAQGHWWAVPAFLVSYAGVTAACGPAVVFHIIAGAAWGVWKGLLINLLAFNANAALHFTVARRLGRARVASLLSGLRDLHLFERRSTGPNEVAEHRHRPQQGDILGTNS